MYRRSNVLHERHDDNLQFSVPVLIGGRWVRCDRGRRLFPNASSPEQQDITDLLKQESDNIEEKWNFDFISEKPRIDGDWEWIPRENEAQSDAEEMGEEGEEENDGNYENDDETDIEDNDAEEDDDDGDLQEVVLPHIDSEDESDDGCPEIKRSRMILPLHNDDI